MSQKADIHGFLLTGNSLTPLDALRRFGCMRLAARVAELRDEGHKIIAEPFWTRGKRVARYWLIRTRRGAGR